MIGWIFSGLVKNMPSLLTLWFVFSVYLNSQQIQAKENELVTQFEPFFISRSALGWTGARAQCTIRAVKQMTFSSRRPLTPSSACRGLVSEGMGKGHMHVDFFTTCPRVKAHKRTRQWRRRKDLWFSLPGPQWLLCRAAAESSASVQMWSGEHDPWSLMWLRGWRRRGCGGRKHYIKPPDQARCWLRGSNCSFTVKAPNQRRWGPCDLSPLAAVQFPFTEGKCTRKFLEFIAWVEAWGWPAVCL